LTKIFDKKANVEQSISAFYLENLTSID
jgi:hypothetical protein